VEKLALIATNEWVEWGRREELWG